MWLILPHGPIGLRESAIPNSTFYFSPSTLDFESPATPTAALRVTARFQFSAFDHPFLLDFILQAR